MSNIKVLTMKKISFFTILLVLSFLSLSAKTRKAVYVIVDGIPADQIERLQPKAIFEIASQGGYSRAYTGGEIGGYSETQTVSAICYTNLLTSSWVNKHNVTGNSDLKPNYNYWTIFRIAKEQKKDYKTAIYSSWLDNRTVLVGEDKPETNNLQMDFAKDGFENDKTLFPNKENSLHIFEIDEHVSKEAADGIRNDAPDLSWVYLWYTDAVGHQVGNSGHFDEYVLKADRQVERIWEAVKYREANFDEEWMVVILTDHGRTESGHGHGGQSLRERTIWISTNVETNSHFNSEYLSIIDISPSISQFMGFTIPRDILWEQDGIPFTGSAGIYDLKTLPYDNLVYLTWKSYSDQPATVYATSTNNFNTGGKDEWTELGAVPVGKTEFVVDLDKLPASKFYKFVVESPINHLNRWLKK